MRTFSELEMDALTEAFNQAFVVENRPGAGGTLVAPALKAAEPDLMLLDMNMPAMDGVEVMERARRVQPDLAIIVLTGHATLDSAIAAVKWGAGDYLIKPDIVICRMPEPDGTINALGPIVSENEAQLSSLRQVNNESPILHASISCKWTLRSDRAQNARSEGLNLVRNRKGRLPHVTVILGEQLPSRIASIALGTGDIDHVYHFALPELIETVKDLQLGDAEDSLNTMIQGKRLRDISDLPLDLVV